MTFRVKLSGIEVGRAAITVGPPGKKNGRRSLKLRGFSETIPFISMLHRMQEEIITLIDLAGVLPVSSTSTRKAPGKDRQIEVTYGPVVHQIIKQGTATIHKQRNISAPRFDPLSALFFLRSVKKKKEDRFTILVLSGTSLYRVKLTVGPPQRLYVTGKPMDTIRLDGLAERIEDNGQPIAGKPIRKVSLWFSADHARIPIKLLGDSTAGPVEAILSSYAPAKNKLRIRTAKVALDH